MIAELVREAALEGVRDELPHSLAVVVEEMVPREGRPLENPLLDVRVNVFVERSVAEGDRHRPRGFPAARGGHERPRADRGDARSAGPPRPARQGRQGLAARPQAAPAARLLTPSRGHPARRRIHPRRSGCPYSEGGLPASDAPEGKGGPSWRRPVPRHRAASGRPAGGLRGHRARLGRRRRGREPPGRPAGRGGVPRARDGPCVIRASCGRRCGRCRPRPAPRGARGRSPTSSGSWPTSAGVRWVVAGCAVAAASQRRVADTLVSVELVGDAEGRDIARCSPRRPRATTSSAAPPPARTRWACGPRDAAIGVPVRAAARADELCGPTGGR